MTHNSFGNIFKITTFGESHGPHMGVVIDGCPAGLSLCTQDIQKELDLRAPGKSPLTSPRVEKDQAQIISGLFDGQTTGAPIAILVANQDADSSKYEPIKKLYRPGHANFTYLKKYGIFDYRGGGRASARETVARVAAGAIAKKLLAHYNIFPIAYLSKMGDLELDAEKLPESQLKEHVLSNEIFCPDHQLAALMVAQLKKVKEEGNSIGGVVEVLVANMPAGLGDPIYNKLEACLAHAMMSIPASKGIEFGKGFMASQMSGEEHNDAFIEEQGEVNLKTNHSGGLLGGISTGMPLTFRVAFKPTSSIQLPQETVSLTGQKETFQLPKGSRHDPCVAIRAVPVVEAMTALVLIDAYLGQRCRRL